MKTDMALFEDYKIRRIYDEDSETCGMQENESAARKGGCIARRARKELEGKTGKKVVSGNSYLPPASKKKLTKTTAAKKKKC